MRTVVVVFPGSNCDRDVAVALRAATGRAPVMVWHRECTLPPADLIVLPGGFSYGDYLRCGAVAALSPVMTAVAARARAGVAVLGICNGFQILTEAGLLPGALLRNRDLRFICRSVFLRVDNTLTPFTRGYRARQVIRLPVAHHDGNYFADRETLARLEGEGRIVLRYCRADGEADPACNPNGSQAGIAGIVNRGGNVVGLMPHPERAAAPAPGGADGTAFFSGFSQPGHPAGQSGHPASQPGHPAGQSGHPASQPGHPAGQSGHPASQPGHPAGSAGCASAAPEL